MAVLIIDVCHSTQAAKMMRRSLSADIPQHVDFDTLARSMALVRPIVVRSRCDIRRLLAEGGDLDYIRKWGATPRLGGCRPVPIQRTSAVDLLAPKRASRTNRFEANQPNIGAST
jgi:hypothetical protein